MSSIMPATPKSEKSGGLNGDGGKLNSFMRGVLEEEERGHDAQDRQGIGPPGREERLEVHGQ